MTQRVVFFSPVYESGIKLEGLKLPNMPDVDPARSLAGAIYYAITENSPSRMHRVAGDMVYHFYSGDAAEMLIIYPAQMKKKPEIVTLGSNVVAGEKSTLAIPGGTWVGSRVADGGHYALMGVTMAPGFHPADRVIANPQKLIREHPVCKDFILSLNERQSFYIFDIDHNILNLPTKIRLFKKNTKSKFIEISQDEHNKSGKFIGREGKYKDYEERYVDGEQHSFRYFNDLTRAEREAGKKEHFISDIEKAVRKRDFRGPSWDVLEYAVKHGRPSAIITARGHSEEVIRSGLQRLVDLGRLERMPNLQVIYCVNNPAIKNALESSATKREGKGGKINSSGRKRIATRIFVNNSAKKFGAVPKHKFGMSDDTPDNVYDVIQAMADSKLKYDHMRFYVINSHRNNHVKMEIVRMKP